MGKSNENPSNTRAHKATDGESKHKKQPSFATLGSTWSSPFEITSEDNDGGLRHSRWQDHFRQLCEYKVQFGDCIVPKQYSVNPKLGQWVSKQRTRYRKSVDEASTSMTAEHIRALNGIGFDWGISKTDLASIWSVRFQQLCEFKVQFGHYLVPIKYPANPELGPWVSKQRYHCKLYNEGKPSPMTEERIRELESVGFKWEPNYVSWNERFAQLRDFTAQFGHCVVPPRYTANPKLGRWVTTQRHNFKWYQEGTPSPMTADRIRVLENIGFEWDTAAACWGLLFRQMREFKVQFGHCLVPCKYAANIKLGQWVATQRRDYKSYHEGKPSQMTAERIRELENIGFDWEPIVSSWSYQGGMQVAYAGGKPSDIIAERIRELEMKRSLLCQAAKNLQETI
jgi:hypothetical protein